MARWMGVVCGLLLVNVATAQEYGTPPQYVDPPQYASPVYAPGNPQVVVVDGVPQVVAPAASPYPPVAPAATGNSTSPYLPPEPYVPPGSGYSYPTQPPAELVDALLPPPLTPAQLAAVQQAPLQTVVYSVADLVIGASAPSDPNQALLSMLAQQSEELQLALSAANANGGESQVEQALGELAETLESTFEDEFDGQGSITPHRGTHSLIIRQTPDVHEQIVDLLEQLRRIHETEISVTMKLMELDDATMAFAFQHSGQVLDDEDLEELSEIATEGESELMTFTITTRNGESAGMPMFPGSVSAVASHDHREVRVQLKMNFGMDPEMMLMAGMMGQPSCRVPAGKQVLMPLVIEDSGYAILVSAEVLAEGEAEEVMAAECEPAVETAAQPAVCFQTGAILATVEGGTPDEVLQDILELTEASFAASTNGRIVAFLNATSRNQLMQMLQEDQHCSVISRPQITAQVGKLAQIRFGRTVPVVTGVSLIGEEPVPSFENVECGLRIDLVHSIAADGRICLDVSTEQSEFQEEEVVLTADVTSPIRDVVTAESTFTIPPGQTLVWPLQKVGDEESTLLIILTSRFVDRCELE